MSKIIKTKDPRVTFQFKVERNPIVHICIDGIISQSVQTVGDPHIGRKFKTGVPVHRIEEREKLVRENFIKLLEPTLPTVKYIVITGDLFDKFIVSPTDVHFAYSSICKAAASNPKINYVILPGNHDLSKDRTKVSSFELFFEVCSLVVKDKIVSDTNIWVPLNDDINHSIIVVNGAEEFQVSLHFASYSPFDSSTINKHNLKALASFPSIVFGHYDSMTYNGVGYIPCNEILDNSDLIISGHEHSYKLDGYGSMGLTPVPVLYTGSMQPYSHAEDPDKDFYITIQDSDLVKMDLSLFKDKCVRILCDHTFALRQQIDCLAMSFKVRDAVVAPPVDDVLDVKIEALNEESEIILSYTDRLLAYLIKEKKEHPSYDKYLEVLADKRFAS